MDGVRLNDKTSTLFECDFWVHKKCCGIRGSLSAVRNYVCPRCRGEARPLDVRPVTQVTVDEAVLDVEPSFCYLGDMLCAGGGCHGGAWCHHLMLRCLGKLQEAAADPNFQASIPQNPWQGVQLLCTIGNAAREKGKDSGAPKSPQRLRTGTTEAYGPCQGAYLFGKKADACRNHALLISVDDKAYLRPGTSEAVSRSMKVDVHGQGSCWQGERADKHLLRLTARNILQQLPCVEDKESDVFESARVSATSGQMAKKWRTACRHTNATQINQTVPGANTVKNSLSHEEGAASDACPDQGGGEYCQGERTYRKERSRESGDSADARSLLAQKNDQKIIEETLRTTYWRWRTGLLDTEYQPVVGTDDERGMRKAVLAAFPKGALISCVRHLNNNVADYLRDTVGMDAGQRKDTLKPLFGKEENCCIFTNIPRPGFLESCEEWRQRDTPQGMYTDVYDGKVWSAFQVVDGKPFLADRGNLAFMFNVDWFQPYKCTRLRGKMIPTRQSVGLQHPKPDAIMVAPPTVLLTEATLVGKSVIPTLAKARDPSVWTLVSLRQYNAEDIARKIETLTGEPPAMLLDIPRRKTQRQQVQTMPQETRHTQRHNCCQPRTQRSPTQAAPKNDPHRQTSPTHARLRPPRAPSTSSPRSKKKRRPVSSDSSSSDDEELELVHMKHMFIVGDRIGQTWMPWTMEQREADLLKGRFTLETWHYKVEATRVIESMAAPDLKVEKYTRPDGPTEGLMIFHLRDGTWHPCGWVRAKDKATVLQLGPVEDRVCVLLERYIKRGYCVLKVDIN
ncbi:hypothetical protein Bbelb_406820 [Branchiostoma belcheri]|nr:hypothetical protein Bbelb_406820 [Branchiostoma belcheri]